MAYRTTHRCPKCGEIDVFFYQEDDIGVCDACGRKFKLGWMLIEVNDNGDIVEDL